MNMTNIDQKLETLRLALGQADAVIIGGGAGLSASAGYIYTGERFLRYFQDFADKYGFRDMYSGGFYPFGSLEERWAYWSRYIFINRCSLPPKPVYQKLYKLIKDKDYFVLTTNVDHCFQKAGFDSGRLFYTQGDYGLFQCAEPCHHHTYDNESSIRKMAEAQGYVINADGALTLPQGSRPLMVIPTELVPYCPRCRKPMSMNLRADNTFVEDEGWHRAAGHYEKFLNTHREQKVLFLELGVGMNTPGIIKYPFWQMTAANPNAVYVCINDGEAVCPREIEKQSICVNGDIGDVLGQLCCKARD